MSTFLRSRALCALAVPLGLALGLAACTPCVSVAAADEATCTSCATPAGGGPLPEGAFDVATFAAAHPEFRSYWYQGVAELSRYTLTQARYGDLHPGEAVLVYVTEDFLTDVQTKFEFGDPSSAVPVLKLNASRRFYTGVYPYSLLTSVFVPVGAAAGPALKVTFGAQEWCGSTYEQFNRREERYVVERHSYFQAEADQSLTVSGPLEDDLWVRLRLGPDALPVGDMTLVPASHALRLFHRPTRPERARASIETVRETPRGGEQAIRYRLEYLDWDRTVTFWIEPTFPNRVLAWTETGTPITGGESMTTTATLTASVMLDYWRRHGADDGAYRELLGLEL